MPSTDFIASEVGISRQTITKHLKSFTSDLYEEEMSKYKYMITNVLDKLYKIGLSGNVGAFKVFLVYVSISDKNQQKNYIQINNTRIDEVVINGLPEAERSKIIKIISKNIKDK